MQGKPSPEGGKPVEEAEFLVEEFELTEREASELVTDGDAGEIGAAVQKKRRQRRVLQDVPVPDAPKSDFTADSDEELLKPVIRRPNDRSGGG
jgi:hypothetical protein